MIVDAEKFNEVVLKHLELAPWRPGKWMLLSWMKSYIKDPSSFGFFKFSDNFVKIKEGSAVDLNLTMVQWLAGFRQAAPLWTKANPFWSNLFEVFLDFIKQTLPAILELLIGNLAIDQKVRVVGVYKD